MRSPLISLVLATKNALPHLKTAIDALRRQTYKNFELLVQDGGSTDGTLEYLSSIADLPRLDLVAEPDSGVGQAYNRGIRRCRGDLVCLAASDEYLDDDALERGVRWFEKYPQAAVIYGGMRLVDANGQVTEVFLPPPFELLGFLKNELVPPTAATFLSRRKIGEVLYYDESLKGCPDFDFWIRLGCRFTPAEIVGVRETFLTARADRTSMTYRAESYDQFCKDKLFVLNRFLDSQGHGPLIEVLRRAASAGIFAWAAESVLGLEGISPSFLKWCAEAAKLEPWSLRLLRLAETSDAFEIDKFTGEMVVKPDVQPEAPPWPTTRTEGVIDLKDINSLRHWNGAEVKKNETIHVKTGPAPWSYAAQIPLSLSKRLDAKSWFWARVRLRVLDGQIGIGLLVGDDLLNEKMIPATADPVDVFVKLNRPTASALVIRNGSLGRASVVELLGASVEACPSDHH